MRGLKHHIHHRRDGDEVTVTVVSGAELLALRERLTRFECVMSAIGCPQSGNIDRLSAELSVPPIPRLSPVATFGAIGNHRFPPPMCASSPKRASRCNSVHHRPED